MKLYGTFKNDYYNKSNSLGLPEQIMTTTMQSLQIRAQSYSCIQTELIANGTNETLQKKDC